MKKIAISVLTVLSLLLLILSGCISGAEPASPSGGVPEVEQTDPPSNAPEVEQTDLPSDDLENSGGAEVSLLPEHYDRAYGALYQDGTFYSLENGEIKELSTSAFSVSSKAGDIAFSWAICQDALCFRTDDSWPDRCVLESIPGCTSHLLLTLLSNGEIPSRYFLCNLAQNSIEPVLEDVQDAYSVTSLSFSADLSRAVFQTGSGEAAYYWDENGVVDLAAVCHAAESGSASALLLEDGVLFSTTDETDPYAPSKSLWLYRWEDGSAEQTVKNISGLRMHGGTACAAYGTLETGARLQVINLRTGELLSTGIASEEVFLIFPMAENRFLVQETDGTVALLKADTGETLWEAETGLPAEQYRWGSSSEGYVAACFGDAEADSLWLATQDALLILNSDGTLTVLDPITGETVRQTETGTEQQTILEVSYSDGTVLISFSDEEAGTLLCPLSPAD